MANGLKVWTKKKPGFTKKKPAVTGWGIDVFAGVTKRAAGAKKK